MGGLEEQEKGAEGVWIGEDWGDEPALHYSAAHVTAVLASYRDVFCAGELGRKSYMRVSIGSQGIRALSLQGVWREAAGYSREAYCVFRR